MDITHRLRVGWLDRMVADISQKDARKVGHGGGIWWES